MALLNKVARKLGIRKLRYATIHPKTSPSGILTLISSKSTLQPFLSKSFKTFSCSTLIPITQSTSKVYLKSIYV